MDGSIYKRLQTLAHRAEVEVGVGAKQGAGLHLRPVSYPAPCPAEHATTRLGQPSRGVTTPTVVGHVCTVWHVAARRSRRPGTHLDPGADCRNAARLLCIAASSFRLPTRLCMLGLRGRFALVASVANVSSRTLYACGICATPREAVRISACTAAPLARPFPRSP